MTHFYAVFALTVLWIGLGAFLYSVLKLALRFDRGDGPGERGL